MKKSLLILAALGSQAAYADEGMWMPQQLPQVAKQLKAAGLRLDPANLTRLTEFPMGAIVSLGGCSASFVSPQGLVVTNHHCAYGSIARNSTPERNLLANGFVAATLADELPAAPGSRILVTTEVRNVTGEMVDPKLAGKARTDAMERNEKRLVAACEKEPGYRCTVSAYYGGLAYYLIRQMEIRDVRLVHNPAEGVGKFGGDTDNWMWPRHTGDYSFLRAYVSPDGKPAEFSPNNVPYQPRHWLRLAKDGVKEGDFVMVAGYPGRTNRHRLPSEVAYTFSFNYPAYVAASGDTLAIIARETEGSKDKQLKYAASVASTNNYYKNRQGMLASYQGSDFLARKQKQHADLKAWVDADPSRKRLYAADIAQAETLIAERDAKARDAFYNTYAMPRLLTAARNAYRYVVEQGKPDAERKLGFQARDLARQQAALAAFDRGYDEGVDKALVTHFIAKYLAQPAAGRSAAFEAALGLKEGMTPAQIRAAVDAFYAGSRLGDKAVRARLLGMSPADYQASNDSMLRAAVALYDELVKREAAGDELDGRIQQAYAGYMKAHIAYMNGKGRAVYPDANGTLRVTFGNVKGRPVGADGTAGWTAFTTLNGIAAKATGAGEFNAPQNQLAAIKARQYGKYAVPALNSVPVNYLATLDITGGNSGSAALNAKGELVGLAFDGTLDSIISDWDFDEKMTRSIQLDTRYMLWQMELDKAHNLMREMGAP